MRVYEKSKGTVKYYSGGREITDPKGKAKVNIFVVIFLSLFVAILIFAAVMVTKQEENPGDLTYTYAEDAHVNNLIYDVTVADRVRTDGEAIRFNVGLSSNTSSSIITRVVSNFNKEEKDGITTYTFTIQITGESWSEIKGILYIDMVTDSNIVRVEHVSSAGPLWVVYVVVGVFATILLVLIIVNIKAAAKHLKEAKDELNNKISATQRAVVNNTTVTEQTQKTTTQVQNPAQNPAPQSAPAMMQIRCPYCRTPNEATANRCKSCDAPLR